jgi:hypothetical protein
LWDLDRFIQQNTSYFNFCNSFKVPDKNATLYQ